MTTSITLEQILHDARTHTFFLDYLQKRQSESLLLFWVDVEQYKQLMGNTRLMETEALKMIDIHFGSNRSTKGLVGERETNRVLNQFKKAKPTLDMFSSAQRECVRVLRATHLGGFTQSRAFKDMLHEVQEMKTLSLGDVFRDGKKVRALHLLLQVERPEYVGTLRFAVDLRNRYKPLLAKGLAPMPEVGNGVSATQGATAMTIAVALFKPGVPAPQVQPQAMSRQMQKFGVVKELVELGRFLEKKYLAPESKQFAKGVTTGTATKVRAMLDECVAKFEAGNTSNYPSATQTANVTKSPAPGVAVGAGTAGGGAPGGSPTNILDEAMKLLATAFQQAEEEALNWLDKVAMVEARRTDYFLSPIIEPNPVGINHKPSFVDDVPNPDSILVLRMTKPECNWRWNGPHNITNRLGRKHASSLPDSALLAHAVLLGTTYVSAKNKELLVGSATDETGSTVSTVTKGLKFRTNLKGRASLPLQLPVRQRRSSHSELGATLSESGGALNTSSLSDGEEEVVLHATTSKIPSLARVSQAESVAENHARMKNQVSFDSISLANTELHAHCFPLNLSIEVDSSTPQDVDPPAFVHYFCLPCKTTNHSFDFNCTCLYGACLTRISKKIIEVPAVDSPSAIDASQLAQNVGSSALLGAGTSSSSLLASPPPTSAMAPTTPNAAAPASISTGSSFNLGKRGRSQRNASYAECALSLQKIPNFGLGLNLALKSDGSVVVTRFVSDATNPSPAQSSGRVAIDDELLTVNRVPVHGRSFNDIVGQIKNAPSPVHLRFARGNYLESAILNATVANGGGARDAATKSVELAVAPILNELEEFVKFSVMAPEVVCLLSPCPMFAQMRDVLEAWTFDGVARDVGSKETVQHKWEDLQSSIRNRHRMRVDLVDVKTSLFDFVSVHVVVDVLACLLLERRVLIISDVPERVAPAVLALLHIIRPFNWQHDWSSFIPESLFDWLATRVGSAKPFLAGCCTVDVVPPVSDLLIPKRQGRLMLREEVWSIRERDSGAPSERLTKNSGGCLRAALLQSATDTVILDLDCDTCSGANVSVFPTDLREALTEDINKALGRGGKNMFRREVDAQTSSTERVNAAMMRLFQSLSLGRCSEFALSLTDNVVGLYRAAFLGTIKTEAHLEFLERFTKTETFKDFVCAGWDLSIDGGVGEKLFAGGATHGPTTV